ncbi:MAG: hypothetical protein LBR88_06945 [Zoogloeaceae bacterium]|jgi:hypothetical protein|nr:hypothetical protein [Zoogloeaceae bacterium]
MGVDIILSRLDKVRRTGRDSWMACCPAHDDRSPSLSIRETDGKILLHCFTGCDVGEILAALDLDVSALFPERPHGCTPEGQSQKPERRPFPAADVLRCVAFEALVVLASAKAMQSGELNEGEYERLALAVARIQAALDAAGVSL